MDKPKVSPDFTLDDIRKIRDYHYEVTKDMPNEDTIVFYRDGSNKFLEYLEQHKVGKAS